MRDKPYSLDLTIPSPMAEIDAKSILETIEIIRTVKSLFVEQNPYLPIYSALGGAFVGAVSSFFPNYIIAKLKDRKEKRSTALQLYAEVKATIELAEHRYYIKQLERVVEAFNSNQITSYSYEIQVSEDRFLIYKSSLDRLGVLEVDIQVKVVEFYQLLEAVVQDVKPGGLLNARPAPVEAYEEALRITKRARELGYEILAIIEKCHRIPNASAGAYNVLG
ncbi:MAG TPA: hypothetical protein PLH57_09405 [Oligoflexia bacterium]|nr:hypothetical protein [Oligoflexia bacterium]